MSDVGPAFVLRNEHVLLLLFMWILLAPGTLFTIDLYAMTFQFNAKKLFGTILPQLSIMVLIWAVIVYFTTHREIPVDPYLAGTSEGTAGLELYNVDTTPIADINQTPSILPPDNSALPTNNRADAPTNTYIAQNADDANPAALPATIKP